MPNALIASLLAATVAGLGLAAARFASGWVARNEPHLASGAAGALVGTALLHLLPEGLEHDAGAPLFALGAFLALSVIRLIAGASDPHAAPASISTGAAITSVLGIGLHSFADGAIYVVAFEAGIDAGVAAAAGLVLHEFSEAVILLALIAAAGVRGPAAYAWAFAGAGLSTPAGALAGLALAERLSEATLGALIGAAAGAVLHVGASHVTGHACGRSGRAAAAAAVLAGAAFAALLAAARHGVGH